MRLIFGLLCAATLVAAGGCRHKSTTAASAATPPVPAEQAARSDPAITPTTAPTGGTFDGSKWGIQLTYPAGWTPKPDKDYKLLLIPAGARSDDRSLSLDIPSLPPHLPGMIPLKLVKNGYLEDLRKSHPDLEPREESATIPAAHAVLVTSTWQTDGKPTSETALLMTHGDHVYILRANTAFTPEPALRSAFEAIAHSIQWTK